MFKSPVGWQESLCKSSLGVQIKNRKSAKVCKAWPSLFLGVNIIHNLCIFIGKTTARRMTRRRFVLKEVH